MSAPKVIGGRLVASGTGAVGVNLLAIGACDLLHIHEIDATTAIQCAADATARVYGNRYDSSAVSLATGAAIEYLPGDRAAWLAGDQHADDIRDETYQYHTNPANPPLLRSLTHGKIFIGNADNQAAERTMSGDGTLSDTGALTLSNSGVSAGSYGSASSVPQMTFDAKGRATAASNVPISIGADKVAPDMTNFDGLLSSADNTVQKALETLDNHIHGGGAGDAVSLQGNPISAVTPNDGDVLTWIEADGEWVPTAPTGAATGGKIQIHLDGGGATLATGVVVDFVVPRNLTVSGWSLLADAAGSLVVDLWRDTYANYPPTAGDSVTGSAPPTLSTQNKAQSSTLTGWTTAWSAGDIVRVNINSATDIQRAVLALDYA